MSDARLTESDPTASDRDRLRVEILRAEHAGDWRRADAARAALKGLLALRNREPVRLP